MKRLLLVVVLLAAALTACAPSQASLQTAIAQTQAVWTPEPTQAMLPTYTLYPTYTPYPTLEPVVITATLPPEPSATATLNPTDVKAALSVTPFLQTRTPVGTPDKNLNLSLEELIDAYNQQTDAQKNDFIISILVKRVNWTAKVINVTEKGVVVLEIPNALLGTVELMDVDLDVAKTISKGQVIEFKGLIRNFQEIGGIHIYLRNVELIQIVNP